MKKQLKSRKYSHLNKIITNKLVVVLSSIALILGTGYMLVRDQLINPTDIFVVSDQSEKNVPLASCGVTDFIVGTPCGGSNFSNVSYTCADGTVTSGASKNACQSIEAWQTSAAVACENKCAMVGDPRPSQTPLASLKATPSPSPVPPAGCHYKQVECFKAPCEPVLDCTGSNSGPASTTVPITTPRPRTDVSPQPLASCRPRPACLDAVGIMQCQIPETADMCPKNLDTY